MSAPTDIVKNSAASTSTHAVFLRSDNPKIITLTQRRDFLAAARAQFVHMPAFVLQARLRRDDEKQAADAGHIRVGYTCSKKLGNAVKRNRAKRRLRAIARDVVGRHGLTGWDYVLIGRAEKTIAHEYTALLRELETALQKVHTKQSPDSRSS